MAEKELHYTYEKQMHGYKAAEKIEQFINGLLQRFPITSENALEWMKFARTAKTNMDILEEEAKTRFKEGGDAA